MKRQKMSHILEGVFHFVAGLATLGPLIFLAVLIGNLLLDGVPDWSIEFLTSYPSSAAEQAGILPGLISSFWLMIITALFAFPVGIASAIYLEEYAKKNRLSRVIEINVANLAAVPSIIYGLLGLEIFTRLIDMEQSLLAGGVTLGLLVLPIVITTSRESIRSVPRHLREAGFALGATRWQVIRRVVLPTSLSGILTGTILSLSRALGETAPLIVVGAVAYMAFVPDSIGSEFSALPIQIFNWISRPQEEFHTKAAAAIITLLALLIFMNSIAIFLRNRLQKKHRG